MHDDRTENEDGWQPDYPLNQWGRQVYPLDRMPVAKQQAIAHLVAQPTPPPKTIRLGHCVTRSRAWYEWYAQRGVNPDSLREKIPRSMRASVIERDGYVCALCSTDVEPGDVHIDHIVPVVRGGRSLENNLQVTHSRCNMSKGGRA